MGLHWLHIKINNHIETFNVSLCLHTDQTNMHDTVQLLPGKK